MAELVFDWNTMTDAEIKGVLLEARDALLARDISNSLGEINRKPDNEDEYRIALIGIEIFHRLGVEVRNGPVVHRMQDGKKGALILQFRWSLRHWLTMEPRQQWVSTQPDTDVAWNHLRCHLKTFALAKQPVDWHAFKRETDALASEAQGLRKRAEKAAFRSVSNGLSNLAEQFESEASSKRALLAKRLVKGTRINFSYRDRIASLCEIHACLRPELPIEAKRDSDGVGPGLGFSTFVDQLLGVIASLGDDPLGKRHWEAVTKQGVSLFEARRQRRS